MKRKLVSFLFVTVMLFTTVPTAFAASDDALSAADALHELGLFNGTGTDADGNPIYDLDRAPSRHEAVTMLVRLLGKETEAKNGTWEIPFTDVADWAKPYVGYAYANGLTSGTSATTFGGNDTVTAAQYITFILRALGYESGTDFQWDKSWELADTIGLTSGEYSNSTSNFTRGDVAILSNNGLDATCKNKSQSLIETIGLKRPTSAQEEPDVSEGPAATEETGTVVGVLSNAKPLWGLSWSEAKNYINPAFDGKWQQFNSNSDFTKKELHQGKNVIYVTYDLSTGGSSFFNETHNYYSDHSSYVKIVPSDNKDVFFTVQYNDEGDIYTYSEYVLQPDGSMRCFMSPNGLYYIYDYVGSADTFNSTTYAYLAGSDFRGIRLEYSSATALCAYVYAYNNVDGELCVLTYVDYKIISHYDQFTLHNMTTGKTIIDPESYYDMQADRSWGATKLHYMDLSREVLKYRIKMLQALQNCLATGTNTWDGAYVPASELNL